MNLTASRSRRTSRLAPVRPPANPVGIPYASDPNSIFSHWQLPSTTPTNDLDLESNADLSTSSRTDAGKPTSPNSQPPLPPAKQPAFLSQILKPSEVTVQLSTDDLITIWGRVWVQV